MHFVAVLWFSKLDSARAIAILLNSTAYVSGSMDCFVAILVWWSERQSTDGVVSIPRCWDLAHASVPLSLDVEELVHFEGDFTKHTMKGGY